MHMVYEDVSDSFVLSGTADGEPFRLELLSGRLLEGSPEARRRAMRFAEGFLKDKIDMALGIMREQLEASGDRLCASQRDAQTPIAELPPRLRDEVVLRMRGAGASEEALSMALSGHVRLAAVADLVGVRLEEGQEPPSRAALPGLRLRAAGKAPRDAREARLRQAV